MLKWRGGEIEVAQNSIHNVLIFRLLLKITVSCVFYVLYNHLFEGTPVHLPST